MKSPTGWGTPLSMGMQTQKPSQKSGLETPPQGRRWVSLRSTGTVSPFKESTQFSGDLCNA